MITDLIARLRAEATGDERDGVWEEGYLDALHDIEQSLSGAHAAATHRVTWKHDHDLLDSRIHCDADEHAICRTSCAEGCESWGSVSDDGTFHQTSDGTFHAMQSHAYCNVTEWINNGDVLETYYDGPDAPVHDGPVLIDWNGDDYTWTYADVLPAAITPEEKA